MTAFEFRPGLFIRGITPPLVLADFKLVAFDMDSTLINIECVDEIAAAVGRKAEVAAITEAAMRGEIADYKESLRRRLALLEGVPESALEEVYEQRLRLNPGVERFVLACQDAGLKTLLVSGGFTFFSNRVGERLGLDFARANVLEIQTGRLTGRLVPQPWGDIVDGDEKERMLLEVCAKIDIPLSQAIAVGDGANDLPMMRAAGLSIGYHAKPAVHAEAMVSITEGGMERALELFDAAAEPERMEETPSLGDSRKKTANMKVLILGGSGMVGQGVMHACMDAEDVHTVVSLLRQPSRQRHPKLHELIVPDLADLRSVEAELQGLDACFFCIGTSVSGLDEAAYLRITHDLTLSVAETFARINPQATFTYVSGAGTDSSERGNTMWARVKGRTENELLRLPLDAYMLRPAIIRPMDGIVSKTRLYRVTYLLLAPFLPLLATLMPNRVTTTRQMGRAMLQLARKGADKHVLETRDINAL